MANFFGVFQGLGSQTFDNALHSTELSNISKPNHATDQKIKLISNLSIPCDELSVVNENFLVTTDPSDCKIKIWNLDYGYLHFTIDKGNVLKVLLKKNQLFLSFKDNSVERWDIEGKKIIATYHSSIGKVCYMKLHEDQLVCVSESQGREVWNLSTNARTNINSTTSHKLVKKIKLQYPYLAVEVFFSRHKFDGEILLYSLATNACLNQLKFETNIDAWDLKNNKLVLANIEEIKVKDIKTSSEICISTSKRIKNLKLADEQFVTLSRCGSIGFWDLEEGKKTRGINDDQKIDNFILDKQILITQHDTCLKVSDISQKPICCLVQVKKLNIKKLKLFGNQFIVLSKDRVLIFQLAV